MWQENIRVSGLTIQHNLTQSSSLVPGRRETLKSPKYPVPLSEQVQSTLFLVVSNLFVPVPEIELDNELIPNNYDHKTSF